MYGLNDHSLKALFLLEIRNIYAWCSLEPWTLLGDFNMGRFMDERPDCEGNIFYMKSFNDFIRDTGLFDIPLWGTRFNKRASPPLQNLIDSSSWMLGMIHSHPPLTKLFLIPSPITLQSPSIPLPIFDVTINFTLRVCSWSTAIFMILWQMLDSRSPTTMLPLD